MSGSVTRSIITALVLNLPEVFGNHQPIPLPPLPAPSQAAYGIPGAASLEIPALPVTAVAGVDGPTIPYDPRHWQESSVPDLGYRQVLARAAQEQSQVLDPVEADRDRVAVEMLGFDHDIRSHSMRVALLAGAIARQLGLPEGQARDAAWAARVHDVGKGDPRILELVNSPGKLTEDQRRMVGSHTTLGAELLKGRSDLGSRSRLLGSEVALSHHERVDGTGYPRAIPASETSLEARIVHVADFYDALMERRPYKRGLSSNEALGMMTAVSQEFDPAVWNALIAVVVP
jgi:putative nucleotidyltransferase with HDIG domain